jgi:hypothetical protein
MLRKALAPIGAFGFLANGVDTVHRKFGDSIPKGVFGVGVDKERWDGLMGNGNGCHEGLG